MSRISLVLLCISASAGCFAQVSGRVVDQTQASIPQARVDLNRHSVATGRDGEFVFQDVPPGAYRLTIEKSGFTTASVEIHVGPEGLKVPDLVLKPAPVTIAITVTDSNKYRTPTTTSATKTSANLIDLPVSVQSIPHAVIEEQGALSLNDALRNVSGVAPSLGEGRRDHMLIRGFSAASDQYVDGVRDDALYYRDLSDVESIDVVKGPEAVLYGRGSAGGLIDRITKKPDPEMAFGEIKLMGGSYGEKRGEFDASRPWLGGKLAGRLDGAYEQAGSFRDFYSLDRYAFAPSVLWRPSTSTDVLAHFDYLNDSRLPDRGIPSFNGAPIDVPIGTYYGYPQDDHIRSRAYSYSLTLHHRLSERWSFQDAFHESEDHTDFSNTYARGASMSGSGLLVSRGQYNEGLDERSIFNQSEATGSLDWLGISHHLLAGVELGRQTQTNTQFVGTASSVAALNPVLTRPLYSTLASRANLFTGYVLGTYIQDQIGWKRWRILAGVRRDLFNQAQDSFLAGVGRLSRIDREWSPRVGVVYRLTGSSSLYASYSKTFNPSGEGLRLAANTAELAPERTRNYEAGAKANLLGNRLTATAAIFRLLQNNIRTVDPLNPTQLILVGAQRTQGVEVNLSGRIWRSLNLTGGYALYDPRILRSNSLSNGVPIAGKIPALVPRRSGNLWATYFWTNGFGVGAGVYQASARFAAGDNLATLPGYVRFDAAVFYGRGKWRASFNVRNLLNRDYYEAAQSDSQIMPGAPINGLMTLAYRW